MYRVQCSLNRLQHKFPLKYVPKKHFPNSTTENFMHGFYKIAHFKISENFLTKLESSNVWVATLPKMKCLAKIF